MTTDSPQHLDELEKELQQLQKKCHHYEITLIYIADIFGDEAGDIARNAIAHAQTRYSYNAGRDKYA